MKKDFLNKRYNHFANNISKLTFLFIALITIISCMFVAFGGHAKTSADNTLTKATLEQSRALVNVTPTASPATVTQSFSGGLGTRSKPYLIGTANDLVNMSTCVNSGYKNTSGSFYYKCYYKLTANIDLASKSFTSIGSHYCFSGDFNGNHCKIYNLKRSLFGVTSNAYIYNVIIASGTITDAGGIIRKAINTSIKNCVCLKGVSVTCTDARRLDWDDNTKSEFNKCFAVTNENLVADEYTCSGVAGGIVGVFYLTGKSAEGYIENCFNYATVSSARTAGGIVGKILDDTCMDHRVYKENDHMYTASIEVESCYNQGAITANPSTSSDSNNMSGTAVAGGIVGEVEFMGAFHTMISVGNGWYNTFMAEGKITFEDCINLANVTAGKGWNIGSTGSTLASGNAVSYAGGICGVVCKNGGIYMASSDEALDDVVMRYCHNRGNINTYTKVETSKVEKANVSRFKYASNPSRYLKSCTAIRIISTAQAMSAALCNPTTSSNTSCYSAGNVYGGSDIIDYQYQDLVTSNWWRTASDKSTIIINVRADRLSNTNGVKVISKDKNWEVVVAMYPGSWSDYKSGKKIDGTVSGTYYYSEYFRTTLASKLKDVLSYFVLEKNEDSDVINFTIYKSGGSGSVDLLAKFFNDNTGNLYKDMGGTLIDASILKDSSFSPVKDGHKFSSDIDHGYPTLSNFYW